MTACHGSRPTCCGGSSPERGDSMSSVPGRPAATNVRFVVLTLLAAAPFIAYLTRSLSAANTTISAELGADDDKMGEIIAGFALGYFFFQIPGGMLANAFGSRL